jgi:hypothetical protein
MARVALPVQAGEYLYLICLDAIKKTVGEITESGPPGFAANAGKLARILRKALGEGVVPIQRLGKIARGSRRQPDAHQR